MTEPRTFTDDEKLQISIELIGLDIPHMKDWLPNFTHIPGVLKKYKLTPGEAKNILLDMLTAYSPENQENIIMPIIEQYLEKIDTEALNQNGIDNMGPTTLKWNSTKTDLCELIEALNQTGSIKIEGKVALQKDIVKAFEMIFDIDLKNFQSLRTTANKRYKRALDKKNFLTKLSGCMQSTTGAEGTAPNGPDIAE